MCKSITFQYNDDKTHNIAVPLDINFHVFKWTKQNNKCICSYYLNLFQKAHGAHCHILKGSSSELHSTNAITKRTWRCYVPKMSISGYLYNSIHKSISPVVLSAFQYTCYIRWMWQVTFDLICIAGALAIVELNLCGTAGMVFSSLYHVITSELTD